MLFGVAVVLAGCATGGSGRVADGRIDGGEFSRPGLRRAMVERRERAGVGPVVTERYGSGSAAQELDVYTRPGLRAAPVVVYVHGGAEFGGDKRFVGAKPATFLERGFVFVSTNYRLGAEGAHPNNAADVASAVMWVRANVARFGGDPDRVFLMGHSSGARLAALVATNERLLGAAGGSLPMLRGAVLVDSAQYDVARAIGSGTLSRQEAAAFERGFGRDPAVWREASAVTYVAPGKGIPPMLIAAADRGIAAAVSDGFAERLRGAGVRVVRVDAPEKSHSEINRDIGRAGDRVTGVIFAFLEGR